MRYRISFALVPWLFWLAGFDTLAQYATNSSAVAHSSMVGFDMAMSFTVMQQYDR
jgi:hypothetical protein